MHPNSNGSRKEQGSVPRKSISYNLFIQALKFYLPKSKEATQKENLTKKEGAKKKIHPFLTGRKWGALVTS